MIWSLNSKSLAELFSISFHSVELPELANIIPPELCLEVYPAAVSAPPIVPTPVFDTENSLVPAMLYAFMMFVFPFILLIVNSDDDTESDDVPIPTFPLWSINRGVDVAPPPALVDAISNIACVALYVGCATVKSANGDVVPMPTLAFVPF